MTSLLLRVSPVALALILAPLARRAALARALVDRPRPDRFHRDPTPKVGGLVVCAAAAPAALAAALAGREAAAVALGGVVALATGLLDDLRPLPPRLKLIGQGAAAALSVWLLLQAVEETGGTGWLAGAPGAVLFILGTTWIAGFQNALNMIDNMDGIAGGLGMIALVTLAFHLPGGAGRDLALALALAVLGFLPYNALGAARLFLGDSGSLPIGHAIACFVYTLVLTAPHAGVAAAAVAVVVIPLLDFTFVTVTRLLEGRSPAVGGRDHTTHRVYGRTGSVATTQRIFWLAGVIAALISIWMRFRPAAFGVAALVLIVAILSAVGFALRRFPAPGLSGRE